MLRILWRLCAGCNKKIAEIVLLLTKYAFFRILLFFSIGNVQNSSADYNIRDPTITQTDYTEFNNQITFSTLFISFVMQFMSPTSKKMHFFKKIATPDFHLSL
ncbi:MAG TPA: hypothetical protein DIT05_12560 [Morganella sp. (in: Bacteria)]|nr:hypothetical protein [Morganella sp. (in: enterobacteria)]